FESPTLSELAGRVEEARLGDAQPLPPVTPVDRDAPLPLSFAQERLWFLERLQPGRSLYNVPSALRLRAIDVGALERALGEVMRRHEALRTVFAEVGGAPVQVIRPFGGFTLPVTDLSHLPAAEREPAVRRMTTDEAVRPFDLAAGPLFRATLLRLADDDQVLLLTLHHVVSDGWSMEILTREMHALYAAFSQGMPSPLPELPVQYADYAAWQRRHLSGEHLDRELAFWKERLAGAPTLLELPTDHPRPAVQSNRGGWQAIHVPAELVDRLKALGRGEGATLFMVLLGAFQALLGKYAGTDDVVVGSAIAGRTQKEVEGLIGFFVNTLVLRGDLSGDPTFRTVLHRVRDVTLGAYEHQDVPFEKLVAELQPERSLSHAPLFQVMFTLQNADGFAAGDGGPAPEVRAGGVEAALETTKFDLTLSLAEDGRGVRGMLFYSTDLFVPETIRRMAGHLERVLEQVAARPDGRLSELELLADAERRVVLEAWNDTAAPFPDGPCLHELIEAQALRAPNAPAVEREGRTLTYGALDRAANRLAHALRARGVGPETRVALHLEPSLETAVALLAVLKAGGAYVPLDTESPPERQAWMLADSGARLVLTGPDGADSLPADGPEVLRVTADAFAGEPETKPESGVTARNLAYVIYTSGSTGKPKGVEVTRRGLRNLVDWHVGAFGVAAGERT
ncbi:MAG TPA: condensation domain-containing protein, partial [Longimicrobium sp.]